MKLTSAQLKQIIKEELNHLMLEQQAEEAAEEANKLLSNKAIKAELEDLAANPKVAAALDAVLNQAQMNEEYDDEGRLYGDEDGSVAAKLAGAGVAGTTMLASPMLASEVINSPAFKELSSALSSVIDPALTALLTGGATMGLSVIAAIAIAMAANKVGKPKSQ
mgnify:FL=1